MSQTPPPFELAAEDKIPRRELHVLFKLLATTLVKVVSRSGGARIANQFEQQVNRYARQQGWDISTSMGDLSQEISRLDDQTLLAAYRSSADYALVVARQIVGERLLNSTLLDFADDLTPRLSQIKDQYHLFNLPAG